MLFQKVVAGLDLKYGKEPAESVEDSQSSVLPVDPTPRKAPPAKKAARRLKSAQKRVGLDFKTYFKIGLVEIDHSHESVQ